MKWLYMYLLNFEMRKSDDINAGLRACQNWTENLDEIDPFVEDRSWTNAFITFYQSVLL